MIPTESTERLRRFVLAILLVGVLGSGFDLLLLEHYEDAYQVIPLALLGAALATLAWHAATGSRASIRALQSTMVLFVAAGFAGTFFHAQSNMEFQLEVDPSLSGPLLFVKVLRAKAPPALAPGVMVQLGLLGLAFAYRHPTLAAPESQAQSQGDQ